MAFEKKYMNLYETLSETASKFPHKVGVIDDVSRVTYSELLEEVDKFAFFLHNEHSVCREETVSIMINSSIRFLIAFYAVVKLGAIAVLVNTKLKVPRVLSVLEETQSKLLILDKNYSDDYAITSISKVVVHREAPFFLYTDEFEEFYQRCDSPSAVLDEYLPAVIMHTSGSTGVPKGALISHTNILNTAYGYEDMLGLTSEDVALLSVPIFHILGLSCVSTLFIYLGGTLVLQELFNPTQILDKIQKYKVTHFHSAPVVYIKLNMAKESYHDLSSLHSAVCGGAFISDENRDAFCLNAPNATFRLAYGMTETSGSGMLSSKHKQALSVVRNACAKIIDEDNNEVLTGDLGQLIMSGPIVIKDYYNIPDRMGFYDEWILTGDIARQLPDGSFEICNRKKDIVNRGGEKISPVVVETAISGYPNILQVAVVAMPDKIYGEVPVAAIEVATGKVDIDDLFNYIKPKLAKYEVPVAIYELPHFEYTDTGKVDKIKIKTILEKKYGGI